MNFYALLCDISLIKSTNIMTKKSTEVQVINLEDFNVNQLPELHGKKEEIKAIIDANPIIEIIDTKTYEEAKKSRTAVKTLRTGLEKEKKDVLDRIKEKIVNTVATAYDTEILDVKAAEELRQAPVTKWEDDKKKEAEEKRLAEEKRVADIKTNISNFVSTWKATFEGMEFSMIDDIRAAFIDTVEVHDKKQFAEFSLLFDKEVSLLTEILNAKVNSLTEAENNRLERERLEEEKKEQSRIEAIKSGINLWHTAWIFTITKLSFEDIKEVSDQFENEPAKKCDEFQSEYAGKRAELQNLLSERIEFLNFAEKQRIDQENFVREKKEFEEKQKATRTNSRIKQLTDLGISDEVIENGMGENSRWATLKNSAETEEDAIWNETLLWVKTMIESRDKPKEELSPATQKGIEVEEQAIELINTHVPNDVLGMNQKHGKIFKGDVYFTEGLDNHKKAIKADGYSTSEETEDVIMEVDFEETWESIVQQFISENKNGSYSSDILIQWLSERYEVPKRKTE